MGLIKKSIEQNKSALDRSPRTSHGTTNYMDEMKNRPSYNYYVVENKCIDKLFDGIKKINKSLSNEEDRIILSDILLDPLAGSGGFVTKLEEYGYEVKYSDYYNRGFRNTLIKNIYDYEEFDIPIVTNPPTENANSIVPFILEKLKHGIKCYILLRLSFLESNGRFDIFNKFKPKYIIICSVRMHSLKNGDKNETRSGAVPYVWIIWEKGSTKNTEVVWIY